ncbi:unnamed protein product [Bemisia tabaci]|uniref:Uncharacterized protein n=1 Tax=Bemisia tabaci TaxID=7038 RepID=A0AAI8Y5U6_BEMTA|nr:unnamed protein product [Bemisia tabaci]
MKTHAISSERRSFFRRNLAEVVVPTILDPKKSLDAIDIPKDIEFVKKTCRKDNVVCRVLARLCGLQTDPRCDVSFDGSAEEQASVFISRKLEGDPGLHLTWSSYQTVMISVAVGSWTDISFNLWREKLQGMLIICPKWQPC